MILSAFSRLPFLLSILVPLTLSACTEYWWTRGQPPAVTSMYQKAVDALDSAENSYKDKRPEIALLAKSMESSFSRTLAQLDNNTCDSAIISNLSIAEASLIELEPRLSYGSRPAYGELSGQFRRFKESCQVKGHLEYTAFGLYASRVLKFLASELSIPAPAQTVSIVNS